MEVIFKYTIKDNKCIKKRTALLKIRVQTYKVPGEPVSCSCRNPMHKQYVHENYDFKVKGKKCSSKIR